MQIWIKINCENAECFTFGNFDMKTHGSTKYNKVIIFLRKKEFLFTLFSVSKFKSLRLLQLSSYYIYIYIYIAHGCYGVFTIISKSCVFFFFFDQVILSFYYYV